MTEQPTTPSIYDDMVSEYIRLQAEIEPLQARMEEIKKVLRDLDYGTHDYAGMKVTVARNARLNEKKFRELYPPEIYPNYYKLAPDSKVIKEELPGPVFRALQDEGQARIGVK